MKKLTEGNISKQILLFMVPVLLGNSLQRLYTLADTIMVGRLLGTDSLAAVGAASTIAMLLITICNGFTSGFSIVTGQFFGANDTKRLKNALAGTYALSFVIGCILTVGGFFLIKPLLVWTNIPPELFADAETYLRILIGGLMASMVYNLMANVLRSLSDSIVPLIFLVISVVLNIVLDYFFLAVLKSGVAGAAAATIISQGISAVSCIMFCTARRPLLAVKREDFRLQPDVLKSLVPQGISMSLMVSVVSVGSVILQSGINTLGSGILAGYTAGRKYLEFLMMPGSALSMTSATFVSQNYGARNFARIKQGVRCIIGMGWLWTTISIGIVYATGKYMVMSVTGSDVPFDIIEAGTKYLQINIPVFYALMVLVIVRSALQGMNRKKTPIAASCIELGVKIFAVLVFVPQLGYAGICITEPVIWILGALWVFPVYYITLRRELNAII